MKEYTKCLRCGRKLKTDEAKQLGFGKICYAKWQIETASKPLFNLGGNNEKETINSNSGSKLSNYL